MTLNSMRRTYMLTKQQQMCRLKGRKFGFDTVKDIIIFYYILIVQNKACVKWIDDDWFPFINVDPRPKLMYKMYML